MPAINSAQQTGVIGNEIERGPHLSTIVELVTRQLLCPSSLETSVAVLLLTWATKILVDDVRFQRLMCALAELFIVTLYRPHRKPSRSPPAHEVTGSDRMKSCGIAENDG